MLFWLVILDADGCESLCMCATRMYKQGTVVVCMCVCVYIVEPWIEAGL